MAGWRIRPLYGGACVCLWALTDQQSWLVERHVAAGGTHTALYVCPYEHGQHLSHRVLSVDGSGFLMVAQALPSASSGQAVPVSLQGSIGLGHRQECLCFPRLVHDDFFYVPSVAGSGFFVPNGDPVA